MKWCRGGSSSSKRQEKRQADAERLHAEHNLDITLDECHRFLDAFGTTQGAVHLKAYLHWKQEHGLLPVDASLVVSGEESVEDDMTEWENSIRLAHGFHDCENHKNETTFNSLPVIPIDDMNQYKKKNEQEAYLHNSKQSITMSKSPTHLSSSSELQEDQLQQIVFAPVVTEGNKHPHILTDTQGHRVLYVLPARMNLHTLSTDVYTTAFALYVYRKLQRWSLVSSKENQHTSFDGVVVAVDVRPGHGWTNTPAIQLIGLIRHAVSTLHRLFPGILKKCIIFPIPRIALAVYNCISPGLDRDVVKSMAMISGEAGKNSPIPNLHPYITHSQAQVLENVRKDALSKHPMNMNEHH